MSTPKRGQAGSDELSVESKAKIRGSDETRHVQVPFPITRHGFAVGEQMLQDLQYLLGRGDGWMRWTSDIDCKVVYLKYKFTSLRWPNHYVFVSGPIYDIALWVAALVRKCEKVDSGELVPTQDKPYNHV